MGACTASVSTKTESYITLINNKNGYENYKIMINNWVREVYMLTQLIENLKFKKARHLGRRRILGSSSSKDILLLMMPFFNRNWAGACKGRWAGPRLLAGWDAGSWIVWAEVGSLHC